MFNPGFLYLIVTEGMSTEISAKILVFSPRNSFPIRQINKFLEIKMFHIYYFLHTLKFSGALRIIVNNLEIKVDESLKGIDNFEFDFLYFMPSET